MKSNASAVKPAPLVAVFVLMLLLVSVSPFSLLAADLNWLWMFAYILPLFAVSCVAVEHEVSAAALEEAGEDFDRMDFDNGTVNASTADPSLMKRYA